MGGQVNGLDGTVASGLMPFWSVLSVLLTDYRVPHTHLADILVRIWRPQAFPLMKIDPLGGDSTRNRNRRKNEKFVKHAPSPSWS